MKIAVIRQKFVNYGGAEQFVSGYTNQLANMGHEVHIFANQWTSSNHPNINIHSVRAIKKNSFFIPSGLQCKKFKFLLTNKI